MPIMPKVVSKERREAAARGELSSASGARPAAKKAAAPTPQKQLPTLREDGDDDSATSSDSDDTALSVGSNQSRGGKAPPAKAAVSGKAASHKDPLEDHAAYCTRTAKAEWLFATGQSGPTPPPPKAPSAAAPAPQASKAAPQSLTSKAAPAPAAAAAAVQPPASKSAEPQPTAAVPVKGAKEDLSPLTKKVVVGSSSPARPAVPENPSQSQASHAAAEPKKLAMEAAAEQPVVKHQPLQVTDAEEAANPGRRDFLKLLDLLADEPVETKKKPGQAEEEDREMEREKLAQQRLKAAPQATTRNTLSFAQLHQQEFDKLYDQWLEDDAVQRPFMALESWEKARTLALIRENGGAFDPSVLHAMFRQQSDLLSQIQSASQRFEQCCAVLEQLVVDRAFVRRVTAFLHKHHRTFLASKPSRERGEFAHAEYVVYHDYSGMVQQTVLGELAAKVEQFDADEFFDALFDTPASSVVAAATAGTGVSEDIGAAAMEQQQVLSFEVWEILLSFLKFENFCDVMDDYIAAHYNTNTYENAVGASKVGGLRGVKRRSPPPVAASPAVATPVAASPLTSGRTSVASSSGLTAKTSSSATSSTAKVTPSTKPKGKS